MTTRTHSCVRCGTPVHEAWTCCTDCWATDPVYCKAGAR